MYDEITHMDIVCTLYEKASDIANDQPELSTLINDAAGRIHRLVCVVTMQQRELEKITTD